MKISVESAKALAAQLEEASARCSESLRIVRANENLGVLQVYSRLVGLFLGHSYTNILAPLWAEHPELEPESFKQPYAEPLPSLTSESQAAIETFLRSAALALARAEGLFGQEAHSATLPFGGLAEVQQSVAEIQEFLANPRFRDPEHPVT
jgi:hypothetical protein